MALDPNIALAYRPPQVNVDVPSPIQQFGQVLTLRNLMNQGQLGQMNIEQTRLENEALQRNARDAQTLGSWMQQNQQRSQDITPQEIVAAHPNPTGIKFATAWSAQQTAALTQHKAVLDAAHEEAKTDDRIYNSVADDNSKLVAIAELVRLKRIDGTMASHLAAIPFDSPEFKAIQQRAAAQSLDRLQRIEAAKKEIDLRIAQVTEPSVTQKAIDEAKKAKQEAEGTQPITPYQQQQLDLSKVGKTIPLPADVQKQKVEQQAAIGLATEQAKQGFQNTLNESLVNAVMKDQSGVVYASLPGEKQKEIAPILAQRGWTQFATKPSDTELTKLQDIQKAIGIAGTLKTAIADNSALVGPISGQLTKFPYATERKQLQAQIDLARQIIGRGLEGGVLRKEDEEKYKNILPTMTDTPDVAKSKLEQLEKLLTRDLGTYRQSLKGAGRQLPDTTVQTPPPALSDQAPPGSTPGLEVSKPGAEPKMVWIGPDGKKYYKPPPVQPVTVTDPRGVVHTFKTAKQAEDFKKAAGIP